MNLIIGDLLEPARLDAVAQTLATAPHEDGAGTAGTRARPQKHNLQTTPDARTRAALEVVRQALLSHPLLRSAARPKTVARLMANRYDAGMHYGTHVDEPIIDGERCDLSFTLMLSESADYDGGELVIEGDDQDQDFRLQRGQLLLYPASTLHRVAPVTRGARIAVVGWLRSWIADPTQRAVLFDLDRVLATLAEQTGDAASEAALRLQRSRGVLMRMWAG